MFALITPKSISGATMFPIRIASITDSGNAGLTTRTSTTMKPQNAPKIQRPVSVCAADSCTRIRAAPRGTVKMLRWIAGQPWGAMWRASLPIGGVDGTLARRFKGTALEGKIFAKTGTLNATNALSGYMIAKSGKTLTFSSFANDVPADASATKFIDAALVLVAEAN